MNKTKILGVVGVVVVGLLVVVAINQYMHRIELPAAVDPVIDVSQIPDKKAMPFSGIVKLGGSYKCTVTQYLDAGMTQSTEGTVYLDNGKIRGEYSVSVQGMNIDTSVIVRDGFAYTWTSMSKTGYKVATSDTAANTSAGMSGSYGWNDKMIGNYNCVSWTADQSKFTLPAFITFQEIAQ